MRKITKKEYKARLIGEWVKEEKYNLAICTIDEQTFGISCNVVYGKLPNFKKFLKDKYDFDIVLNDCIAMTVHFPDKKTGIAWNFILIQDNEWTAKDYGVLCHETHHLVHFNLPDKGINYGEGSEEVFAYVQGWFMEMLIRTLAELRKIKNIKRYAQTM